MPVYLVRNPFIIGAAVAGLFAAGIGTASAGGQSPRQLGSWAQESFSAGYVLAAPDAAEMAVTQSFSLSDVVANQLIVDQRVTHAPTTRALWRTTTGRYLYQLSNLIVGDVAVHRPEFDFLDRRVTEQVATNPTVYVLAVRCRIDPCIGGSEDGKPYSANQDFTFFGSREKAEAAQKQIRELVQFATATPGAR